MRTGLKLPDAYALATAVHAEKSGHGDVAWRASTRRSSRPTRRSTASARDHRVGRLLSRRSVQPHERPVCTSEGTSVNAAVSRRRRRRSRGPTDLTHPLVAEPAEPLDERRERDALDRIEVHDRGARHGSSPGSSSTSLGIPRIVVVHGPISARRSRGIAASRDSTTTGRRPISGSSHHQTSPRVGRAVTTRRRPRETRRGRPTRRRLERKAVVRRVGGIDLDRAIAGEEGAERLVDESRIVHPGPRLARRGEQCSSTVVLILDRAMPLLYHRCGT